MLSSLSSQAELTTDFSSWPSYNKFSESAKDAWEMDQFQIPFYAGIVSFLLFDGEVSKEATEKAHVFGSAQNASDWSDGILLSLIPLMIYTSTLTNTPTVNDQTQFGQKAKLIGFEGLFIVADYVLVSGIKSISKRNRPDKSDTQSFPSGHSSVSAGLSVMIYNNIQNSMHKDTSYGVFLETLSVTLAATVAYARVEAVKHHLSDVFFGHAIGAFIGDVLYKSFLQLKPNVTTSMYINQHEQKFSINYNF